MLICDNGVIREMTPEEVDYGNNLPDPTDPEASAKDYDEALEELGVVINE